MHLLREDYLILCMHHRAPEGSQINQFMALMKYGSVRDNLTQTEA